MFISVKILPLQQVREAPSVLDSTTAIVVNFVRGRKAAFREPCPLLPFAAMQQIATSGPKHSGLGPGRDSAVA